MIKNAIIMLVAISVMTASLPVMRYRAASYIGSLVSDGKTRSYTDFDDLIDDLEDDYEGRSVEIVMLCDWDASRDSDYDERIIIPGGCRATLTMDGHVFNRDLAADNDWCRNGELICVRGGATLTVNGGKKTKHVAAVYNSRNEDRTADRQAVFYGGLLCGGASTNGAGGIHIEDGCTVTLNDVTLAGCRAEQRALTNGEGGGVSIMDNSTLRLNDSAITGCYAYNYGGGIYQSIRGYLYIELKNSRIDSNFARKSGGGMYLRGDHVSVTGDGASTVSGNYCGDQGGGICVYDDGDAISGLTMENNVANDGGAVYSDDKTVSLTGLTVKGNRATNKGAGIYISHNENTISSCVITGNSADKGGSGVYVLDDVRENFVISGVTVIKDNTGDNLYIADDDCEDTRVLFNLSRGSDVRIRYYDYDHNEIMVTPGSIDDTIKSPNCSRFLHSDQQGYYFGYDERPNARKIIRYRGEEPSATEFIAVSAEDANGASGKTASGSAAGKIGRVGAGGDTGTDYDLIRGYYTHQKTDSDSEDLTAVFYYSDGLFYGDPYTYNEHLGTLSINLAFAAAYLHRDGAADAGGNTYCNKHAGGRQFLADIGCSDDSIYVNDSMVSKPGTDSIGVLIGSKALKKADGAATGDILVPVTFRSAGYESEWASNMTLGTAAETVDKGKEAKGFSEAADEAFREVMRYLEAYGLEDEYSSGKVIFWVCGYSRAGATANLTSKRLVDRIAADGCGSKVFGYTCEAPKGGSDEAELERNYRCIHNMINKVDIVPYVGPEQMGFKRYGVDHYIPGTEAGDAVSTVNIVRRGGAQGITSVTTYRDNEPIYTKTDNYETGKKSMLGQLAAVDSGMIFDDYFHPMAMDFIPMKMYEEGNYAGNRAEDFIEDFVRFMQEGTQPNELPHYTQAIYSRDKWAGETLTIRGKEYNTVQGAMRETMAMIYGMSSDKTDGFISRASSLADRISTVSVTSVSMREIYDNVIGEWYKLDDAKKEKYITFFGQTKGDRRT